MSDKTQDEHRKPRGPGRPFPPGVSPNPHGRPKGSRNKAVLALEALFDGEGEAISRKAIEMAKSGDPTMVRLCIERILPARKDRPITLELPPIETASDALKASATIVSSVAEGQITPVEASDLSNVLEKHLSAIRAHSLEERVAQLELQTNGTTLG